VRKLPKRLGKREGRLRFDDDQLAGEVTVATVAEEPGNVVAH
jgi:hypothetical protein